VKAVVAGASGLVGGHLVRELAAAGHEVVVLSRSPERAAPSLPAGARAVRWDGSTMEPAWPDELAGADWVVNLAGESVGGGRWTSSRKARILDSRVDSTRALVDAMRALPAERRPSAFACASGIDYAGDTGDDLVGEDVPAGDSFLARVCVAWEEAARQAEELGVRVVRLRTAFVLAPDAKALRLMTLPFRFGAGGPLGNGRQWFPWIHVDDLVGLYRLALESELSGPLNAVSPGIVRQRELAAEVGRVLHRPAVVPTPSPMLRLALGNAADLLLHGRRAEPRAAEAAGYEFRWPELRPALEDALR
jgi:uncharacterized protein (TIGR01777 family)